MKTNKLVYNLLVGVGLVLLVLPLFLSVWTYATAVSETGYALFTEFGDLLKASFEVNEGGFASFWATLTAIVGVVALAAAALYVALFVVELVCKKKNFASLKKLLAFVMLVCGVVALVSGIIFTSTNKVLMGEKVLYAMKMAVGFWLLVAGALLGGLFGLLGAKTKSTSKSKR